MSPNVTEVIYQNAKKNKFKIQKFVITDKERFISISVQKQTPLKP